MTIKNLFAFAAVAALFLAGCSKPKLADLTGQTMYLTSATLQDSRYLQMCVNFKGMQQVEIFAVTNLQPMYCDVTVGNYSFNGQELYLPTLGVFTIKPTNSGFYLYKKGKLAYRLSKSIQPFIKHSVTAPQRQYQFASITTTH